ncbi:YggS family pyridoxal phosphate-dependent enzyme [Pasteuria penetrans]|uniref:YggS family pyridoxal phosphate-dependent enzyme n=1 Tax=Pasteuria penetrans TaxID=86005 RepID=UPI000FA20DB4|nr:YggS family pyridoxal phosphate-dependent enzyme [Pasteuria penetrans]
MQESQLYTRWQGIHRRLRQACARVNRDPATVRVVTVTKSATIQQIRQAQELGWDHFGESRPQEALRKRDAGIQVGTWHLIGRLQRNKCKWVAGFFRYFHALDRMSLLEPLSVQCERAGTRLRVFLQINVSGEASKAGFPPSSLAEVLDELPAYPSLQVVGWMTMAPRVERAEEVRPVFRRLASLQREWAARGNHFPELSMGMSNDFEVAIEEGATWVRIGSSLFAPDHGGGGN